MRSVFCSLALAVSLALGCAQPFTYQGSLRDGGNPANGNYQMTFRLYNAAAGGTLLGTVGPVAVPVSNGLFSVELNFPASIWDGGTRYLEIQVGATTLSPRVKINPTPYASTLRLFESGVSNPDRMVIAHSPAFTNWGLMYRDTTDEFHFMGSGSSSLSVRLLDGDMTFYDDQGSIIFSTADATNAPMMMMFSSGANNADRMVIAHSPAFTNWGLQYRDSDDKFNFMGGGLTAMSIDLANLYVGVRTFVPEVPLHVASGTDSSPSGGGFVQIGLTSGANLSMDSNEIMARNNGAAATLSLNHNGGDVIINGTNAAGNVGIGTTSPAAKLHVNGTARVRVLEITGADFAEKFPTTDEVQPGMVVEIDPDNPGNLRLARGAYNKRVAGIVAGANGLSKGIVLGNTEGSENHTPIAISGRVWVYADSAEHAIEPGDFLTTAERAGYAMKATDLQKAQGAILGKAMTRLEKGQTGFVLVLVNLQ